jgi:uncharacterized protein (DUF427 family)
MRGDRIEPGPGQESVWDYPRPPAVESCTRLIEACFGGVVIARSARTKRVLETSHPPVYYVPAENLLREHLVESRRTSFCEFKGVARYFHVAAGGKMARDAAWSYPNPVRRYAALAGHFAFYPSLMDECFVDGELVTAQDGDFYGGWITSDVVGPFKGSPGSWGW